MFLDCDLINQVHVMPRREKGPEASEKEARRVGSVCKGREKNPIQFQINLFFHLQLLKVILVLHAYPR